MSKENITTNRVTKILKELDRKFTNVQGTGNGKNGEPDIITLDSEGKFLAIEIKSSVGKVYPNQYRQARHILECKGRFIVAFPDILKEHITGEIQLPKIKYEGEHQVTPKYSHELIL